MRRPGRDLRADAALAGWAMLYGAFAVLCFHGLRVLGAPVWLAALVTAPATWAAYQRVQDSRREVNRRRRRRKGL